MLSTYFHDPDFDIDAYERERKLQYELGEKIKEV